MVPAAAAASGGDIAFTMIGSGPTVTLGEELLYSELSGEDACRDSGLSEDEIERALDEEGPSGFDPRPYLERVESPGLWIYGALDRSLPVRRSVRILEALASAGKAFSAVVIPRLNHSWVLDGGICQQDGPGGIEATVLRDWLLPRGFWPETAVAGP